ncbi:DUF692 domain-containing protein [Streptomyces sp. NPDC018693]|uniref:DUF692 domain-containing protein n=1 Tax=unclassified Streptomyces TaxID=2593676 RepID=UPI0037B4CDE4
MAGDGVRLGAGIGWRPEIADAVERMPGIDWVEVVAENVCPGHLPDSLVRLRERGVTVVPHGVSLGLGGAERPDEGRLAALAERAEALRSPLVTEHIAFVRAGGPLTASPRLEAGHLLPVPRTRDALDVLCENVRIAQEALPVPLAVENIAALISWPGEDMTEGQFLYELADRTGVRLLIDVANLHTNHVNRGEDPAKALAELPLEALAYVHVAGGFERDGVWHDSHAHPVPGPVLDILTDLASRVSPPGVLLERDENFPEPAELERELAKIEEAVRVGARQRGTPAETPIRTAAGQVAASDLGAAQNLLAEVRGPRPFGTGAGTTPDPGTGTGAVPDLCEAAGPSSASDAGVSPTPDPGAGGGAAGGASSASRADAGAPDADVPVAGAGVGEGGRVRLALAQTALLSALVAGTPAPEGFDRARLAVQARALAGKRAGVVAKVAPELPEILGAGYRPAFLAYAHLRPLRGGYRRDALDFAEHLLRNVDVRDVRTERALREWWLDRSGPAPRRRSRLARVGRVLIRR